MTGWNNLHQRKSNVKFAGPKERNYVSVCQKGFNSPLVNNMYSWTAGRKIVLKMK